MKYLKYLWPLAIVLIPTLVFAQDATQASVAPALTDIFTKLHFTPQAGDLSIYYLTQLFGNVPGALPSGQATILGQVFAIFNAGILAVTSVVLGYTTVKTLTETAMDGSPMGQKVNLWFAVRASLGTALLVPRASGYSLINGVVMWVVVQGVGLADLTWSQAMNYMKQSGASAAPLIQNTIDPSVVYHDPSKDEPKYVGSTEFAQSQACMQGLERALRKVQTDKLSQLQTKYTTSNVNTESGEISTKIDWGKIRADQTYYQLSNPVKLNYKLVDEVISPQGCAFTDTNPCGGPKTGTATITFPYIDDVEKFKKDYGIKDIDPSKLIAVCGVYTWAWTSPGSDEQNQKQFKNDWSNYVPIKKNAMAEMNGIMEGLAKQLLDSAMSTDPDRIVRPAGDAIDDPGNKESFVRRFGLPPFTANIGAGYEWPLGTQSIVSAGATYQADILTARGQSSSFLQTDTKKYFDDATKGGWILAGSYYNVLSKVSDLRQLEKEHYHIIAITYPPTRLTNIKPIFGSLIDEATWDKLELPLRWIGKLVEVEAITQKDSLSFLESYIEYLNAGAGSSPGSINVKKTTGAFGFGFIPLNSEKAQTLQTQYEYGPGKASWFEYKIFGIKDWLPTLVKGSVGLIGLAYGPVALVTFPLFLDAISSIPVLILKSQVQNVLDTWYNEIWERTTDAKYHSPIIKLKIIGEAMINASLGVWQKLIVMYQIVSTVLMAITGTFGFLAAAFSAGSFWTAGAVGATQTWTSILTFAYEIIKNMFLLYLPLVLSVVAPMFIMGITLAIYVPLIPFMLFTFGAINWMISVLIVMAAAPIICFLMIWSGQGEHWFLGRETEQFILQLLGAFLRPALMVIGLIAGVTLSYVAANLMTIGFTGVISDLQLQAGGDAIGMVKNMAILIVFTLLYVSVINICFSPIHLLYSEALSAAGISRVPAAGREEAAMGEVKTGMAPFAQAGAEGGAGAARGSANLGKLPEGGKGDFQRAPQAKGKPNQQQPGQGAQQGANAQIQQNPQQGPQN